MVIEPLLLYKPSPFALWWKSMSEWLIAKKPEKVAGGLEGKEIA
jgi:hypothetical protein